MKPAARAREEYPLLSVSSPVTLVGYNGTSLRSDTGRGYRGSHGLRSIFAVNRDVVVERKSGETIFLLLFMNFVNILIIC